jgi:hypothetical protein
MNPVHQFLTLRVDESCDFLFGILLTCQLYRLYSTTVESVMVVKNCELIMVKQCAY